MLTLTILKLRRDAALELYFEPFLAFFFPVVHELIDWSRSYEALEQEFQQFVKDSELGKRFTDKLFKVWRQKKNSENRDSTLTVLA